MSAVASLLRLLPPETAHRAAIRALPWLPARRLPAFPRLRTRLAGLDLPHPIGLAAGFDKNAEAYAGLLRQGFAFVETGTVTPRPQAGNPRPRLFRLDADQAIVNRLGFNNDGIAAVARRLAGRDRQSGVVGVNIGMNRDAADPGADYRRGPGGVRTACRLHHRQCLLAEHAGAARAAKARRARPAADGTRARPRRHPSVLEGGTRSRARRRARGGRVVPGARIDALIVGNTTLARPAGLRSAAAGEAGGLSGRPLLPRSTRLLARMAVRLAGRVPLIGVGGVASGADAYAKIRAGASAVQLYTAMIYQGPRVVGRIVAELDRLAARDGLATLADVVGADAGRLAAELIDPDAPLT